MSEVTTLYGGPPTRRVRTRDLLAAKVRGDRWPMLTSYDQYTAGIFDAAGYSLHSQPRSQSHRGGKPGRQQAGRLGSAR